ncbi:PTS sugar transporter subunit IIB [Priestia megaterium]|jgi:PTS system ascorbate-specific IIB component|uniref:PTS system, Lactose/Cellobiose specific IIB subunit n=1 Tax=Priestia megaterium (strain ATCC 14581 / DSM 32 / CCUG 1817 / JCM 2506 / NBRC 15308 / NCIMB 9376 / NCTC 10342 / NRRL B-14308 / VKM B-512 / Ford 19) TaxID=1348623 RepID=A0A0B6AGI5_PRIM2|nr:MULTISPECIES: PTS sugar transporter subunit IIB [Priestia]AJI23975.1 PTS system, Lactose/Cellobiose specific IIB subunit [Priestia megaterium NBRC 15308 = ATCC 14581]KFM96071.1 PTS system, Lactose/Cellobiose specific IIB subunit [Priestia megaterium]KGJ76069.1 PTS lactose transporter subunit IIB [Priestia megaterium NBRC 15308 = ATCC 14581]MBY0199002.1 PTS sugar transporter subunit IIB [Priestia megaterium]MCU7710862.1 PTS sugar transporter subunit IIB [Priestia megaterium]
MKKILVVCGNGLGSSFIVEMNVKKILVELGVEAQVSHTDLTTSKTEQADIYLGSADIVNQLDDGNRTVVALQNILNQAEIKGALQKYFVEA